MKIIGKPPFYFFACIVLIILFPFVFSDLNLIASFKLGGIPFIALGIYLIYVAYDLFKKKDTTVTFKDSTYMIEGGVYQYSRNPMYLGALFVLFGIAMISGNLASFILPVIFFFIINFMFIPFEEEKMEITFQKKYLDYKERVRRWI